MTRLEKLHVQETENRYGISQLQVDKVSTPREMLDSQLNQDLPAQGEHKHFQRRMNELKAKFGVTELACDGILGARLKERTLEQATNDDARQRREAGKFQLATAKVNFQGKPLRLFYEISF